MKPISFKRQGISFRTFLTWVILAAAAVVVLRCALPFIQAYLKVIQL